MELEQLIGSTFKAPVSNHSSLLKDALKKILTTQDGFSNSEINIINILFDIFENIMNYFGSYDGTASFWVMAIFTFAIPVVLIVIIILLSISLSKNKKKYEKIFQDSKNMYQHAFYDQTYYDGIYEKQNQLLPSAPPLESK